VALTMVAPTATPNVIAVAIAMIRKSCRVRAFIAELSVGGPDARRDQTPGMPGAFQQGSRSAAIGGRCQLVQVHEPSGNDGPLTIHHTYPQRSIFNRGAASTSSARRHSCGCALAAKPAPTASTAPPHLKAPPGIIVRVIDFRDRG
jgi:hypothetical protein